MVVEVLTEYKDEVTFVLEASAGVSDPEDLFDASDSMSSDDIAALNTEIQSSSSTVTLDDSKIAVSDTGKLADTYSDEDKGALNKMVSDKTDTVATTISSADSTAGKKMKVKNLRKFFLSLGFPHV